MCTTSWPSPRAPPIPARSATGGSLVCWGDDSEGQLDGIPSGDFRSVSAGGGHTCAIRTDGTLACWGDDSAGQLDEIPAGEFDSVSAGGAHTCAVRTNGGIVCWGDNSHGQSHPVLAGAELPRGVIGDPYSYSFHTTGQAPGPQFQVTAGHLPAGLELTQDGRAGRNAHHRRQLQFHRDREQRRHRGPRRPPRSRWSGRRSSAPTPPRASPPAPRPRSAPRSTPATSRREAWFEYWPAASPQSATHTPATTIAAAVTQKGLNASIAGLTPDTHYAYRVVATNELAPEPGPELGPGAEDPAGPRNPASRRRTERQRRHRQRRRQGQMPRRQDFSTSRAAEQIPVGCELDTDSGTVALTASRGSSGATQSAYFWGGTFEIDQSPGDEQDAVATLAGRLRCEKRRRQAKGARASAKRGGGRKLWGAGSGNFKTVGNYGSASVLGTTWLVIDRCDLSSVFEVKEGRVKIRDFIKGISAIITPGKRYVAKAPFLRLR